jgi:DNA-binding NarL/FixJ family response regulator
MMQDWNKNKKNGPMNSLDRDKAWLEKNLYILELFKKGLSNRQIATRLGKSISTVIHSRTRMREMRAFDD